MISKLNDPEILQRKATNNKKSAWVTASAGTGKTKILIDRLLSLLLAGNLPERLLCLAFTRAAAAEITNRVFERLSNWTTCENKRLITDLTLLIGHPPNKNMIIRARRLFAQVLDTPGGMKIETIHAFCQSLLRRFPLEAGLASHFQIMSDYDTSEILSITREEILNSISNDNCSSLTKAISTIIGIINETDFLELINELIRVRRRLSQLFNRYNGLTGLTKVLYKDFNLKQEETAELLLQKTITETSFDICGCRNAVNVLMTGSKSDHNKATVMIAWMNSEPSIRIKDFSKWCSIFLTKKNTIRSNLCTKNIKIQFPETLLILETEAKRLVYTINRLNSIKLLTNTIAVLTLAEALFTSYDHKKKARAMLDYDDLILNTIALLEQPNITPWVLYKLDGGIDHILIDEAQDINPEQWRVIKALTGEFFVDEDRCSKDERTIFVVGDDKQLIYSFQGADPREFELMRQYYKNQILTAKGKWIEIEISTSFRSAPAILKAVDLTINSISYDKEIRISDYKLEHLAFRQGVAGLVEVWPIICSSESRLSEPSIESEPWHPNIKHINNDHPRSRLAKLIARRIEIMINSGEILISRKRAICPSDILILVRHRSIFVEELVRELKALNIAVSGIDRMILTEQPIVMDLVALANVLLLPNDDLTLATVLKSPLIGLSEDDLFNLAHNRTVGLWETLKIRAEEPSFTTIWQKLSEWQHMANQMSPHDFFIRVLSNDGKKRLLAYLGAEAEDPLDEFITLTLVYERTYPPSLQNFLHWLEQDSIEIKRDLDHGNVEAVRIMTVHGAKGLQAPIVFLPDTIKMAVHSSHLLWLDKKDNNNKTNEFMIWLPRINDQDEICKIASNIYDIQRNKEYIRLLYVAMTRAEDRLYICGWKSNIETDTKTHCWYNLIFNALKPVCISELDATLAQQSGIENFEVLRLTSDQTADVLSKKITTKPITSQTLPAWINEKAPFETSPRSLVPSHLNNESEILQSFGETNRIRFQRGNLIHRILQSLPNLEPDKRNEAIINFLSQPYWKLSFLEQTTLISNIIAILNNQQFAPIFGTGSLAEVPIVGFLNKKIVSGQIDRLLVTKTEVLIIDYKTNKQPPLSANDVTLANLHQIAIYKAILSNIYSNRTISCALLWTNIPQLMVIDNDLLNDALFRILRT